MCVCVCVCVCPSLTNVFGPRHLGLRDRQVTREGEEDSGRWGEDGGWGGKTGVGGSLRVDIFFRGTTAVPIDILHVPAKYVGLQVDLTRMSSACTI